MASSNTNKQPVFIDRPLFNSVRVTTNTVGTAADLNVQGGQAPALLVDMDAAGTDANNSGGVIDSLLITRNDLYPSPEYTIETSTSGNVISLTSGQTVYVKETGVFSASNQPESGVGYYTYTGGTPAVLAGVNTSLSFSGLASATTSGFSYAALNSRNKVQATFVFYQTRDTTLPVPASGDYKIIFSKTLDVNTDQSDCGDQMPQLATPVAQAGNTTGLGETAPLRNKGIYLQKGDRLYVGIYANGANVSGYSPGAHITAQGGYF